MTANHHISRIAAYIDWIHLTAVTSIGYKGALILWYQNFELNALAAVALDIGGAFSTEC